MTFTFTARRAKEISLKNIDKLAQKEINEVFCSIKAEAELGKTSIGFPYNLSEHTIDCLKENGFIVSKLDGSWFIEW